MRNHHKAIYIYIEYVSAYVYCTYKSPRHLTSSCFHSKFCMFVGDCEAIVQRVKAPQDAVALCVLQKLLAVQGSVC